MKRKRKSSTIALFLSASMLVLPVVPAAAAAPDTDIEVNGHEIDFTSRLPLIEKGITYAPQGDLLKALNATFVQSDKSGTITVLVDNEQITVNAKTKIVNGTTYVPVRVVSEQIGYKVEWDPATRTIILTTGGKGFLWEVSNGDNTVYLVGSMHIADDSFYPLDPSYDIAFEDSEYLGVEIDLTQAQDETMQKMMLDLGMYQDGTTLKDHISSETYEELGEILVENGLEKDALDGYKPWVVEITMSQLKSMEAGYQGEIGIDLHFLQKAIERKMPIIELETYQSQLELLSGFSGELQETNLKSVLDNFHLVDDSVDQMAEMWKLGDEEALLEITNSMKTNEEYYKGMLVDRNLKMADKIEGYLTAEDEADYFIVVGAAHYAGEDGIVKLLQDRGYTVTRK
ncbi:TraB/GumN family protein [Paenibacillus urinalis]|uniref:TraB/GumN family protein n=1 Tax=Paenibacillus urinalis TaxID=521520 RepID=UPI001960BCB0